MKIIDSSIRSLKTLYYTYKAMYKKENDIKMMEQLLKEGDTCLDIGACFGLYTYWMSKLVGTTGKVVSVEPMVENFYYLTANVINNSLGNVKILNNAVWDKSDIVHMVKPTMYTGCVTENGDIEVVSLTIEDIFELLHLDKVNFIKVDGGSNLSARAIFGCKKIIEKFKPILLLESNQEKHKNLFQYLGGIGYTANYFNGKELKAINEKVVTSNYFFIYRGRDKLL